MYWPRWRIEEAYLTVKRLLGLSHFACTHANGVLGQRWATGRRDAVLTDRTDAVAEELQRPFALGRGSGRVVSEKKETHTESHDHALLSVAMGYCGLSHFSQAYHKGRADAPMEYLAQNARELAMIKTKRPKSLDAVALLTNQLKA